MWADVGDGDPPWGHGNGRRIKVNGVCEDVDELRMKVNGVWMKMKMKMRVR